MKRLLIIFSLFLATSLQAKESILVVDIRNEKIVAEQNSTEPRALASITKLMTAIVALELGISDRYLIDTMLVQSNNKSAEDIASKYGRREFIQLMNFQARQLGMNNTKFIDPSGLGMNISTAEDVAILVAYSMKYSEIRDAAYPTVHTIIPKGKRAHYVTLHNTNSSLLKEFTHITVSKTGYTSAAGWCVAMTTSEHIIVVLGSRSKAARNALAKKLIQDHTTQTRPIRNDLAFL